MTGLLHDVMHERAEALTATSPDVAAIVRAGERRVARRRTAWAGGGIAAGLALAAVAPLALGGDGPAQRGVAPAAAFAEDQVVYSLGSTIHAGARTIEAERDIVALATTEHGVVFADEPGGVWSSTGGEPVRVGRIGLEYVEVPDLFGGGSLVAWLAPGSDGPVFTVLDQRTGETHELAAQGAQGADGDLGPTIAVGAVDGDTVYVHDDRGPIAWEPATGTTTVLETAPGERVAILDVQDGVFAYAVSRATPRGDNPTEVVQRMGRSLVDGVEAEIWNASVSPDGLHLLSETDDENVILETGTGRRVPFDNGPYSFLVGHHWLDQESYAAIGFRRRDNSQPVLLRCDLSGACTPLTDLPAETRFALPTDS